MALTVGFDTAPLVLNRAGEFRYASRLLAALRARPGVDVRVLGPTSRVPRGPAQRVALQAAVQGGWYPGVLPWRARRAAVDVMHHPRHLVPPTPGQRAPAVVTVHDVLVLRAPELFSPVIRANFRLLTPRLLRRAAKIATGSEFSRREIAELLGVDRERIAVTPYGVDERFRPAPMEAAALRDRFGIDRPYVLCVGTLEPRKNLLGALRAFGRLARDTDEFALVVAGGRGWGNEAFEAARRAAGDRLVLTGYVSDADLVGLLSAARCFLYPSLFEGFGFPPLEAMACGTPVVTADRASLPEVVGDAAALVDPEDEEAIAAALRAVLEDPGEADRMRRAGLDRASLYTWEACAAATIDVYRDVLASRTG